jgi:radical SAM-linked protein
LRFCFSKTGSLVLLSHLDLVRLLERALRRSALPVSFTGGFHPLPRVQFGLALPLGVEALGEWMDVELAQPLAVERARAALQQQLPEGFALLSVAEVPVSGPSLSQQIVASSWQLALEPASAPAPPAEAWQRAAAALLAAESWIWHDTDKKGRPRQRDCRPFLQQLQVLPTDQSTPITLNYRALVDPTGRSLRPEQLQHWFATWLDVPLDLRQLRRLALHLAPAQDHPNQPC